MSSKQKTLKQYCKDAKKRLKQGFWQNYKSKLDTEMLKAEQAGISKNMVKEYYNSRITENIRSMSDEKEEFYQKVKKLLLEEGEAPNAIGRLTDVEHFNSLSYEEKQRYTLSLSEKYLEAIERFRKEQALEIKK